VMAAGSVTAAAAATAANKAISGAVGPRLRSCS
jgi:hypothetical protein